MHSINRPSVRRWLIPLALLAGASAAALSCGDPSPVGVEPPSPLSILAGRREAAGGLISCTPAAYDTATKVNRPAGGIPVAGGSVLVVVSQAVWTPPGLTAGVP